jgi:futalosine hydrolase
VNVLIVSATAEETVLLRDKLALHPVPATVDFLVTGIGMVATTYSLTRLLQHHNYDLAVAIGVAGAIDHALPIGEVVQVSEDAIYNFGVEDGPEVKTFAAIGLTGDADIRPLYPFSSVVVDKLRAVKAVSVNTGHGNETSISLLRERTDAVIENMEGAAFFFVCNQEQVCCLQLRAISNRVERRNRAAWDLPKALQQLSDVTYSLLQTL